MLINIVDHKIQHIIINHQLIQELQVMLIIIIIFKIYQVIILIINLFIHKYKHYHHNKILILHIVNHKYL